MVDPQRSDPPVSRLPQFRELRRFLKSTATPLELRLVGRTLLHAVLVGAAAGIIGSVFYFVLELTERVVLEGLSGYIVLRAGGEDVAAAIGHSPFRPWILLLLPCIGGLFAGILMTRFAPETRGGGIDPIIEAFHEHAGMVRRRVPLMKSLASIFTLGFGGSGGREGPTMQIGGALGSIVARALRVGERERRILLVAGIAAGVAAVFRTPLGAALLAVEILHRDDFESDALVPSVLASVVAYSVFISFFGEATLFAHAPRYPFIPQHLPLYALMALVVSLAAAGFEQLLRTTQRTFVRIRIPPMLKPALGGLLLGALAVGVLLNLGRLTTTDGQGIGLLGGGYGAAQLAITGASWLPGGWLGVQLLALLALLKAIASSLTIGSGGSAGVFGPSLVIGGLVGGAFGRAAELLLDDPSIDPGAFALVAMGTFYGGLAHVPIASLVMICELAGSYDLLVPLMLAEAIAFIALRKRTLHSAQVETKRDSKAHRHEMITDVLRDVTVADVLVRDRAYVTFGPRDSAAEVLRRTGLAEEWQDVFPVLHDDGRLLGVITTDSIRTLATNQDAVHLTLAIDLTSPAAFVHEGDDMHAALERMLADGARELVVLDEAQRICGFLDELEIQACYHQATTRVTTR